MFEITNDQKKDFIKLKNNSKAYLNSVYDFTFENRFHVYHYPRNEKFEYIALDKSTGYGSFICSTNKLLIPIKYRSIIPDLLYTIKYTGDQRYKKGYSETAESFIDLIFKIVMPQYGFAKRDEQINLSKKMYKGLVSHDIALCEAEVGTGKTFAYLVAGLAAKKFDRKYNCSEKPITISTSSIELQHSIIKKDIPMLSNMLIESGLIQNKLNAVLRKGKEHYFCFARYKDYLDSIANNSDNYSKTISKLNNITFNNLTFDLDKSPDIDTWLRSKICVKGNCINCKFSNRCKYYLFLYSVKKEGAFDFQITNHNLLLASQMFQNENNGVKLLNSSNYIIIDEAHKLRNTAASVFGAELSSDSIPNFINSIKYQNRKFKNILLKIKSDNDTLFKELFLLKKDVDDESGKINLKVNKSITLKFLKIINELKIINNSFKTTNYRIASCKSLIDTFKKLCNYSNAIYWLNVDSSRNITTLYYEPMFVSEYFRKYLWNNTNQHFILTSGTMKDDRRFNYFKEELGISNLISKDKILECSCESPFDYQNNSRIYISENVCNPLEDENEYINSLSKEISKLIFATNGHTTILFTSYKTLSTVYNFLEKSLIDKFPLFKMSKSNKSAITDFKHSKNGVLFASGSMWEGVDCAGDILSSVIIVKLPFPIRTVALEHKKNQCQSVHEFIETYAVPEMLIKLRQGSGRLIRNETDTGVLSILDARVAKGGSYRARVLRSLYKYPIVETIDEVADFILNIKSDDYKNT